MFEFHPKRAAWSAFVLALAIPAYWLSVYGLFFEKMMFPKENELLSFRSLAAVIMHLAHLYVLWSLKQNLNHYFKTQFTRILTTILFVLAAIIAGHWLMLTGIGETSHETGVAVISFLSQSLWLVLKSYFAVALLTAITLLWNRELPMLLRIAGVFLVFAGLITNTFMFYFLFAVLPLILAFIGAHFAKHSDELEVV